MNNISKGLLIFCYVTLLVGYMSDIFIYVYGGPSSLWTLHPLKRSCPLGIVHFVDFKIFLNIL